MQTNNYALFYSEVEWRGFEQNLNAGNEIDQKRDGTLEIKGGCEDLQVVTVKYGSNFPQDVRIGQA